MTSQVQGKPIQILEIKIIQSNRKLRLKNIQFTVCRPGGEDRNQDLKSMKFLASTGSKSVTCVKTGSGWN